VRRLPFVSVALAGLVAVGWVAQAGAQLYEVRPNKNDPNYRRRPRTDPQMKDANGPATGDTRINVEVFTGEQGVGYQAQRWEAAFEQAGANLRIRSPMPGDKLSIREKQIGKLREVFVVGRLETNGSLSFPGHVFKASEVGALGEWLAELKSYGSQGSPRGKALWGLNADQFESLFRSLGAPIETEIANVPLEEAIKGLALPERYPFRMSYAAQQVEAAAGGRPKSKLQLKGFSQGTALALLLSQYDLGFRPERTPAGKIELVAVPADNPESLWPTGWEHLQGASPVSIAPKLFEQTTVELKDQKLAEVLEAIGQKTNTPVLLDSAHIDARGLDVGSVQVSVERRRYAWVSLLTRITSPSLLTTKICCDEARRPFVWVTPLKNAGTLRPKRPVKRAAAPPVDPNN
jgi:hypothetical protein